MTHGRGKSNPAIVAGEADEQRWATSRGVGGAKGETEGNAVRQSTRRTQGRVNVSHALDRIRQVARQRKKEKFTALLHHIGPEQLEAAFFDVKKNAAPGVDGLTWRAYETSLGNNIADLHSRLHRGAYRTLPSRRVYIPKPDGRQRPLAVAALEDKIVQRAAAAVLNVIYEEDFLGFSYGFRPGRGQHDALDALVVGITTKRVNFILDADIRSYFDSVSQDWLIRFVEHRIKDPRMIRLIQKWLKAGVLEDGVVTVSERGTGQGAVISPLLANIYLHYVFDLWAERWRRREASGDMILVRYADDIIVGFEYESDARQFWDAMRETFGGVLVVASPGEDPTDRVWPLCSGPTRSAWPWKTGNLHVPRLHLHLRTIPSRPLRAEAKILRRPHAGDAQGDQEGNAAANAQPIPEQGKWLRQVVTGFLAYHAVPTNIRALNAFRHHVTELWRRSLRRRSQKDRMTWDRIRRLADDFLPKARILHPWPQARFPDADQSAVR